MGLVVGAWEVRVLDAWGDGDVAEGRQTGAGHCEAGMLVQKTSGL